MQCKALARPSFPCICVGKRSTKDGASPAFIAHLHSQVKVGRPFCSFITNFSAASCLVIWQGTNISTQMESAQALWKCSSPLNTQLRTRENPTQIGISAFQAHMRPERVDRSGLRMVQNLPKGFSLSFFPHIVRRVHIEQIAPR